MINAPTIETLTSEERITLEQLEAVIDRSFIQMGEALQQIKQTGLYREYGTWEAYCKDRWSKSARRIDQLISGSLLAANIQNERSDLPDLPGEYQARALSGLPFEKATQVWETTTEVYGDRPTALQVETTRERLQSSESAGQPVETEADKTKRLVYAAGFALVTERMNEGSLTPKKALAICDALKSAMPKVCGDVLRLGVLDEVLIREINRLFKNRSDSYDELVRSECLQFENTAIPIQKATAKDLRNWLDWKSSEHRRAAFAEKLVRDRYETAVLLVGENRIAFNIPAIEDELKVGDRVRVTIVRM